MDFWGSRAKKPMIKWHCRKTDNDGASKKKGVRAGGRSFHVQGGWRIKKRDLAELLREKLLDAAISAADRLKSLLEDENASNGDVVKAAALALEMSGKSAGAAVMGDYEIRIKED